MATNATVYTGESGVVKFGGAAVAEVKAFTIDQEQATVETTTMGSGVRSYLPSLSQFSGSLDVIWRDDDAGALSLFTGIGSGMAELILYPSGESTGITLTMDIIITGHSISSNFDGLVEASVSFQGTKNSSGTGVVKANIGG
tara:strand:- start:159 stop:584 length:426 start_codon:yes stop_codon:yes gene_type:complete